MSNDDTIDTKAWGKPKSQPNYVASMPVDRYASEYNMNHGKRGHAIIFNHEYFNSSQLNQRHGTNVDAENLQLSLEFLGFDVKVYKDLTYNELRDKVNILANLNHENNDCILIAILSHGENGFLYAKDIQYKLDSICFMFTGNRVPTLAGKPKLFFIQACQGDQLDSGITLQNRTETDSNEPICYKIPIHADFLVAYSTIPGFYSWRNTSKGSWFMQSLCNEINEHGKKYDILTLLTFVCQHVAYDFESCSSDPNMHQQKQIPCITTMLTRILRFN